MKKKFIILAVLAAIFTYSVYADTSVRVYVNNMRINQDAILYNNLTYVPLRAVSEALGAEVEWDQASSSAYVSFSEDNAIAKVVENVSPSVVTIVGNYAGASSSGAVQFTNPTMHGTGVIYKSNGYIVTNAHVVEDIKNLTVVLNHGESCAGKVLYSDEKADLAVVKIDKVGLNAITMADRQSVISGRTAIAIGTPISLSMRNSVTKGIVSGVDVDLKDSYYKLIQTDAAINPGNSGGPLLNINGELIGINSSKFAAVGVDNMGFAIPVDTVQFIINQFEQYGRIVRPVLNFTLEQGWEADIGLPSTKGITVKTSQNAALSAGDIITAVNGIEVHSIADWNEAVKDTYNGSTLAITFTRAGQMQQINIEC